jgi:hypothetical protein
MRATRVFIPDQVAAVGKYLSELHHIPLPDVYTGMLIIVVSEHTMIELTPDVFRALESVRVELADAKSPPPF